jgi:plasmid stability protein
MAPFGADAERRAAPLDLRARACAVLGASGSLEARDVLLKVLAQDGEPSVRAAAIEALGRIAWDADGASAAAIGRAVGVWPDPAKEPLALAAAGALESIALYEGVPPGPRG